MRPAWLPCRHNTCLTPWPGCLPGLPPAPLAAWQGGGRALCRCQAASAAPQLPAASPHRHTPQSRLPELPCPLPSARPPPLRRCSQVPHLRLRVGWALGYVAFLGVNLASSLGWLGATNKEISDKFPTPLTPAGWAFSIWGLIFLLQGGCYFLLGGSACLSCSVPLVLASRRGVETLARVQLARGSEKAEPCVLARCPRCACAGIGTVWQLLPDYDSDGFKQRFVNSVSHARCAALRCRACWAGWLVHGALDATTGACRHLHACPAATCPAKRAQAVWGRHGG